MNWNTDLHKLYAAEKEQQAQKQRMAQEAKSILFTPRRRVR